MSQASIHSSFLHTFHLSFSTGSFLSDSKQVDNLHNSFYARLSSLYSAIPLLSYSSTPPRKLATVVPTKSEPNVLQLPSHKSHHITSLPCGPNLAGFPRVFSTLCSLRCSVPFPHPYHHTLLVSFRPCLLCFGGPFSLPAFWRSSIPTALDLLQ